MKQEDKMWYDAFLIALWGTGLVLILTILTYIRIG